MVSIYVSGSSRGLIDGFGMYFSQNNQADAFEDIFILKVNRSKSIWSRCSLYKKVCRERWVHSTLWYLLHWVAACLCFFFCCGVIGVTTVTRVAWVALSCIDDVLQSKQLLWHRGALDGAESVFLWWPSSLHRKFEGIADFRSEMYSYLEYCGGLTSCLWGCQGKPPRSIHPARAIHHLLLLFLISNTIFSSTHIPNSFYHCVQTVCWDIWNCWEAITEEAVYCHMSNKLWELLNTVKVLRSS